MRRTIVLVACWCLVLGGATASAGTYEDMVAKAKAGDAALDYGALRNAFADSTAYQPYGGNTDAPKRAMHNAFNAQDCAKVLAAADEVLAEIFVDIEAHLLSARCFENGGDQAKAALHRAIAKGLMDSIVASGNGKTPRTAFIVVTIDEEYSVLSALRWRLVSQSLINDDGHIFDRMDVKSATSEETAALFFQIDRPMKWLSSQLGGASPHP